jgi:hypothetical protein
MVAACSEGGEVEVDGSRKRTAMARFRADDEATACSRAGIEEGRWWRRRNGF